MSEHNTATATVIQSSTVRMRVTYVEVDRMGFLHHSNHVRWFERGREEFLRRRGVDYAAMENAGNLVVVVDLASSYKIPLRFEDVVDLTVNLVELRHATLSFAYELRRVTDGALAATGQTRHCVLTREGRIVRITQEMAEVLRGPEKLSRRGEIE